MSPVPAGKVPSRPPAHHAVSTRGFTFVEVIVSMAVTVIVMASVFALLARGFRTTDADFQRSDLQAQARHALDEISRDLLAAGSGLPPEFPAFTPPNVNPDLDASGGGPEAIEIVGSFDSSAAGSDRSPIVSFDGETVRAETLPPHIRLGDLVLLYDDEPTNGTWLFGLVSSLGEVATPAGNLRQLTIKSAPGDTEGDTTLPAFIEQYNRRSPTSGFITPVTVVSYKLAPEESLPEGKQVLWRQVNWGEPTQVALVEDLQFRYFIGTTVSESISPPITAPRIWKDSPPLLEVGETDAPPPPGGPSFSAPGGVGKEALSDEEAGDDKGLEFPPVPQPDPTQPLLKGELVRGVGISVTSRSARANLVGSILRSGESPADAGFLRVTFASRVAARNVMSSLSSREHQEGLN